MAESLRAPPREADAQVDKKLSEIVSELQNMKLDVKLNEKLQKQNESFMTEMMKAIAPASAKLKPGKA